MPTIERGTGPRWQRPHWQLPPRQHPEAWLLAALLALCAVELARSIHWSWVPMEDAAMLLRYAQHLAAGHGIRWNLNQPPVDGATDFLYMALIAALSHATGVKVATASRCLNLAAQLASVALVFLGARRLSFLLRLKTDPTAKGDCSRWLALAAALYLIAGPFTALANACFGAPVFAFFLAACWLCALRWALEAPRWPMALAAATTGLLAGLTRPEGVLVAGLILLAAIYLQRGASPAAEPRPATEPVPPSASAPIRSPALALSRPLSLPLSFLLVFGLLGGAYFAWRWRYFGYPLPNPFYIKGDGRFYPDSIHRSVVNLLTLLLPALPLIPLGWLSRTTRRLTTALLLVLVPFALMWGLLLNENNHFARFQYAIVPLVLMTVPALAGGLGATLPAFVFSRLERRAAVAAVVLGLLCSTFYASRIASYQPTAWGMQALARRLAPLAPRGYTMAVTEAGVLPLDSGWNAIDALGLNDATIAHHHGEITSAYLDQLHPELILAHIDRHLPTEFSPGIPAAFRAAPPTGTLGYGIYFLNHYAFTHGYTLAAAWGPDPCNLHLYWVRPGFADYATVLSDVRDHPYVFLDDGFLAHDYRNDLPSLSACAAPDQPTQ